MTEKRMIAWIPAGAFTKGRGHRVSFVIENEVGHCPNGNTPEGGQTEPWYWGNPKDEASSYKEAQELAREYNQDSGISEDEETEILCSSFRASNKSKAR